MIERPVKQERIDRMPVARAQRAGKAAVQRAAGEDADQIGAIGGRDHGVDRLFRRGERASGLACGPGGVARVQQIRVLGQRGQFAAHAFDRGGRLRAVGRGITGERERYVVAPCAVDQRQRERGLPNRHRLAHARLVEAHEVGRFAAEIDQQHLCALERGDCVVGQIVEQLLHRDSSRW